MDKDRVKATIIAALEQGERIVTEREGAIISAYTGVLACDFDVLHAYIEEKLGRPAFKHELASEELAARIKEVSKADFLAICPTRQVP